MNIEKHLENLNHIQFLILKFIDEVNFSACYIKNKVQKSKSDAN